MTLYLPIAEMSVNILLIAGLGTVVGVLSGMFGIGGGFLMAPVLVMMGVPASVAVASQGGHVVATSSSSIMSHARNGRVDYRMGGIMALGGALGAIGGVEVFRILRLLGQADLVVAVCYLVFLGVIGSLMLVESLQVIWRQKRGEAPPRKKEKRQAWLYALPFKMRFPRSGLYISVLPPLAIGVFVGILSALMGVGGGFIVVPAMIYLLRMKPTVVVGTGQFQIIITSAVAVILQAARNQTVDAVLALLLLLGGVIGGQIGTRLAGRFRAEELRAFLALLVLLVGIQMGISLFLPPAEPFMLAPGPGGP